MKGRERWRKERDMESERGRGRLRRIRGREGEKEGERIDVGLTKGSVREEVRKVGKWERKNRQGNRE